MINQRPTTQQIVEGMEVYDRDGKRIGTVKAYRSGEGTVNTNRADIVTMANAIDEAMGKHKTLPTVMYTRLYDEGFVSIKRGFMRSNVVAFLPQVDDIHGDAIFLNVFASELVSV